VKRKQCFSNRTKEGLTHAELINFPFVLLVSIIQPKANFDVLQLMSTFWLEVC